MSTNRFSCYLIGADTLLMECGEILLDGGHDLRGVITAEPRIASWAEERGIGVIELNADYADRLAAEEEFDFLFAITHLAIIPDAVLDLPRRLAVNFHDGPLPRYAGLNTPVWALMNGEEQYGISWHVMTSGIDRGSLLKQVHFDLAPSETALSLNTKCLAAATESFPELIQELAAGAETYTEQDPELRTYFGKHDRPDGACAVDWSAGTAVVEAFVRGLSFGPYPNPMGLPKSFKESEPGRPFVIDALSAVTDEATGSAPGTVLALEDDGMTVATGDGSALVTVVRSIEGREIPSSAIGAELGLAVGDTLGTLASAHAERLTEVETHTRRAEAFWERRLLTLEPPQLPQEQVTDAADGWTDIAIDVPGALGASFGDAATDAVAATLAVYLARTGRKPTFDLSYRTSTHDAPAGWFAQNTPLRFDLDAADTARALVDSVGAERALVAAKGSYLLDLTLRDPAFNGRSDLIGDVDLPVGILVGTTGDAPNGETLCLVVDPSGSSATLRANTARISEADARIVAESVSTALEHIAAEPELKWVDLRLASPASLEQQLRTWNATDTPFEDGACVHQLFEATVDARPDETAIVFEGQRLTYRELDEQANALAHRLQASGIGPDDFVGVNVERSLDLLIATLGTMKAGGAYVPLDPDFPADRLAFMVEDSGARVIVTQSHLVASLPDTSAEVIQIDADGEGLRQGRSERPASDVGPAHIAYAIYTSGSTGKPKGVLVEHRNVSNFFTGMDAVVAHDPPGVWLAVTSLSFDISVLELFWTLARGFKVVVYKDRAWQADAPTSTGRPQVSSRGMDFGLFMWGNDDGDAAEKYDLMLDAARYFDSHGFSSAWTPERHFHAFGGPFPNPSVTGAALAAVTKNLDIRAGSCVSPLHHPVRIAEEWAVVDNLSRGRVGLAFAAGWQPNDFLLRPESFPNQKQVMMDQIDIVRRLWRGESVEFENPMGNQVAVTTLPRPIQKELPFWVTTAGNPDTYRSAGAMGANVLTHLLGQSLEEVAEKIAIYRTARAEAGLDPAGGTVTLMLHTFVGESNDTVREIVREPMKSYLGASMKLVLGFAWSFPAFKRPGGADAEVEDVDLSSLTPEETDAILDFAFERYFETSGLFGTVDTCVDMVEKCKAIDVDEIACLLDYGVPTAQIMDSLPRLKAVSDEANRLARGESVEQPAAAAADVSFAAQVREEGVTHLQCTPSMAQLLLADPDTKAALDQVEHLMIGGEAFPPALAKELAGASAGTITNMYGPTETTIWSATHRLDRADLGAVPIGQPIANTQVYVLDPYHRPIPVGTPGELFIGGDGVTRGYHNRDELTNERFVADPFNEGGRMYGTGDLVRWNSDGILEFIGRIDHQVKIRGYRIELGEIEAVLNQHDDIRVSAVVVREPSPQDQRLFAFYVPNNGVETSELQAFLQRALPEYMVPSRFVALSEMPLTPNGKIDRKALPDADEESSRQPAAYVEPANELEQSIAKCWMSTLGTDRVGTQDNFFDIGGHSLLVVQLHRALTEAIEPAVSLVDLYRFPTIRALSDHLSASSATEELEESADRARKRRQVMARRRRG